MNGNGNEDEKEEEGTSAMEMGDAVTQAGYGDMEEMVRRKNEVNASKSNAQDDDNNNETADTMDGDEPNQADEDNNNNSIDMDGDGEEGEKEVNKDDEEFKVVYGIYLNIAILLREFRWVNEWIETLNSPNISPHNLRKLTESCTIPSFKLKFDS